MPRDTPRDIARPNDRPATLLDAFGVTYLINLPERTDRLKSAKHQFARAGWSVSPAGINIFPAIRCSEPEGFPSAPVRGCFQSHLECLRQARDDRRGSVLILEDDVVLSTSLPRLTPTIATQLANQKWDFAYLGHHRTDHTAVARHDTREDEFKFEVWTADLLNAEFYAVNERILPRLIEHLERISRGRPGDQNAGPMPVDGAYNIFRRNNPDVRCLIAVPRLGRQLASRSDITPHPVDKLPMLWPINNFLRKIKKMVVTIGD
jgi:glycosyl transferase, family 25